MTKSTDTKSQGRATSQGSDAYQKLTERVGSAYASARDKAGGAARDASSSLEGNPMAALLGGLALGAVAGALVPRGEREKAALGSLGARVGAGARAAIDAARANGAESFTAAGFGKDAVRAQASRLVQEVVKAATSASGAAADAAKSASASN